MYPINNALQRKSREKGELEAPKPKHQAPKKLKGSNFQLGLWLLDVLWRLDV
jgi:hypothetical protein